MYHYSKRKLVDQLIKLIYLLKKGPDYAVEQVSFLIERGSLLKQWKFLLERWQLARKKDY